MTTVTVRDNPALKELARRIGYRKRRAVLIDHDEVSIHTGWNDGSRSWYSLFDPASSELRILNSDPAFKIPGGYFVVETGYTAGKVSTLCIIGPNATATFGEKE